MKRFTTALTIFLGAMEHAKLQFYASRAVRVQAVLLRCLMRRNAKTEYGKLHSFKQVRSVKAYQDMVPLTTYEDYQGYIGRMVQNGEQKLITAGRVKRYAETSGSVGKPKLVPLAAWNLWVNQCFSVSYPMGCAYRYYRAQKLRFPPQKGMLTMEGVVTPLPSGGTVSCASALPMYYIRSLIGFASTSPAALLFPRPGEARQTNLSYFKLRFALTDRRVSYLSSMSINVLEALMSFLEQNWEMLCDDIGSGRINESIPISDDMRPRMMKHIKPMPERAAELRAVFAQGFDEPIARRIWPDLGWIYAMGAGSLAIYRKKLGRYTGDIPVYHTGYVASEGLMAVPAALGSKDCILLPQNCFFEFLPVEAPEDSRPLTISEVEEGREYEVILTNCSGLYRYCIRDVVRVTGFYKRSPLIQFMYRRNQLLNICGEKTTQQHLDWAVEKMCEDLDAACIGYSIYPDTESSPGHYEVFVEFVAEVPQSEREHFRQVLDKCLDKANTLLPLTKQFNGVGDLQLHFLRPGTYDEYWQMRKQEGVNLTQAKPIVLLNTPQTRGFIQARVI